MQLMYRIVLIISFMFILPGCISFHMDSDNLQPGQLKTDEESYITGSIQIDVPDENKPPANYRTAIIGLERQDVPQEKSYIFVTVNLNEAFYKSVPKGKYHVKSLSYFILQKPLSNAGISLNSVNIAINQVEVDLTESDFSYLGDLHLSGRINAYGNSQRSGESIDKYERYNKSTAGWLLDNKGYSVPLVNKSEIFDNMMLLEESFPTTTIGYNLKVNKSAYIECGEAENLPIPSQSSMAFVSVDTNYATKEIVMRMEEYAIAEFNTSIKNQEFIKSRLPEYPAILYADNFTFDGTVLGSFESSESYDESFDSRALELVELLGVDYLFILYHINGISYDTNDPGFMKKGLVLNMRGRLFSAEEKESMAYSLIIEKEETPVITLENEASLVQQAEESMYQRIATGIVDGLYGRN